MNETQEQTNHRVAHTRYKEAVIIALISALISTSGLVIYNSVFAIPTIKEQIIGLRLDINRLWTRVFQQQQQQAWRTEASKQGARP